MLAGTITQSYTWKWALDQNDATLAEHLANHQIEILQGLAADALKTVPNERVLRCSVKILKTLTTCAIDYDRLNAFIQVLKVNGLLSKGDNENGKIFIEALNANNFEMAKSLLMHFGPPFTRSFDSYDLVRKAIDDHNQALVCFILENNLITSRSLLKSLFGTACDKRLFSVIETLFDKIPGYETPQETIAHHLREAIRKDQLSLVKLLLSKVKISFAADLEFKNNLLVFACCLKPDSAQIVELFLKSYKAAPDFSQERYSVLINKACKKAAVFGNTATVRSLINEKANVDLGILSGLLYQREDEFVIELLEKFPQNDYYELLMISMRVGAEFVVIKLLNDYEQQILADYPIPAEEFYLILLENAFQNRNSMAAYFCIERVAKPLPESIVEKLMDLSIANESEGLMILLLENQLIPRSRFFTFLIQSARLGFLECTRELLRRHVNINLQEKSGLTPLMAAAAGGHVRIQDLLISAGAKINTVDSGGNTALHYAAFVGSDASVKLLVARGININCLNLQMATPLHIAIEENCIGVVKLLLSFRADSSIQNGFGETPFHLAIKAETPSLEIIELLAANADLLTIPNHLGQTPFGLLLKKNLLKPIRQYFFPFSGLAHLSANMSELDRIAVESIPLIMSPHNLSYAIPLELALLLNHYPLAHSLARLLTPHQWQVEINKLKLRYPFSDLRMIKDARYELHQGHFSEGLSLPQDTENNTPVFPATMTLLKDSVLEAFDRINFSDASKQNYRNPNNLRNDGEAVKPDRIREGLSDLFTRVKNRTPFLGTPKENSVELFTWYEKLERLLHDFSLLILKKNEEDEKASLLIEIGIAGLHCGGRWVGTLQQLYQFELTSAAVLTLPEMLKTELRQARSGIIQCLTEEGNVHQYNHFLYLIGEELGLIPKNTREKYKDALANVSETRETLLVKFYKMYNPRFVIDYIMRDIEILAKNGDKRDILIDWFKENIPLDWNPNEGAEERKYSFLMESLYDQDQKFKVKRSSVIYMLQKFNILC